MIKKKYSKKKINFDIEKKSSKKASKIHFDFSKFNIEVSAKDKIIIPLNSDQIREKAEKECKKVIEKIDILKTEIDQFETRDKPSYDAWVGSHFQDKIESTRKKMQDVEEKREIVEEVYNLSYLKKISFPESFQLVMEARELEKKREEEWKKRQESNQNFPDEEFEDDEFDEDEDDVFRDELNDFFKKFNEQFKSDFHKEIPKEKKTEHDQSFKDKYRELVKKLHPDKNKNQTKEELELWNELQDAYKTNDESKLDYILQNLEMKTGKKLLQSTIFDLRRAKLSLEKSLRGIQSQIRKFKKDVAWNFFSKSIVEKNKIKKEIEDELRQTNYELDKENTQFTKLIETWKNSKFKPKNKPQKREIIFSDDFFEFFTKF